MARDSSGALWAWGAGGSGQLGTGDTLDRATATRVAGFTDAIAVSAGAEHVLSLRADGTLVAWGDNGLGQLGTGTTGSPEPSPVAVAGLTDVVAIQWSPANGEFDFMVDNVEFVLDPSKPPPFKAQ